MLIEYNEMKEGIKIPDNIPNILNVVRCAIQKQRKRIVSVVRKILQIIIHVSEELNRV